MSARVSDAHLMIREMHRAYGHPDPKMPRAFLRALRAKLILEECAEAADAIMGREHWHAGHKEPPAAGTMVRADVAKELADILVVTYGAADVFSIPLDAVLVQVHESNMSKVQPDGSVIRREDGKIMKGPRYVAPRLEWV